MSEMGHNTPIEINCVRCKTKFTYEKLAAPQLSNIKDVSMVVWVHKDLPRCPNCLQAYQPILGGISLQTQWGVIPAKEEEKDKPKIIVPARAM